MPAPVASPPQPTVSKPSGGVLPISAVTNHQQSNAADHKAHTRGPSQRLKVVIRRLPPGLTRNECEDALGDEWKIGRGKISWTSYKPGKISKDLSKPSKPARAYFQVTQQSHLESFAEKVQQTSFLDAKNTANDASLFGPPTLEFAPYGRVPSNKKRNDVRQGLIDQDPEFIAFLESLTNPVPKVPTTNGSETSQQKEEVSKTTPLIQYLRDKKAAKEAAKEKEKEKAAAKSSKHNRQGSSKIETTNSTTGNVFASNSKGSAEVPEKKGSRHSKTEKVTKQSPVKQLKRDQQATESKSQASPQPSETAKTGEAPSKRRENVSPASAAARMIQRDLGLKGRGGSRVRGGRQATAVDASQDESTQNTAQPNGKAVASTASKQTKTVAVENQPKPAILKREAAEKPALPQEKPKAVPKSQPAAAQSRAAAAPVRGAPPSATSTTPATAAKARPAKPPPAVTPTATHAFLKHANPSQGITEPLIRTAFSTFGEVSHVEIDKRKGFAYVDFVEPEGLQKAINASPIKIAQGSVQVLERKDRPSTAGRGGAAASPLAGPKGAAAVASPSASRGNRGKGKGSGVKGGANVATNPPISSSAASTPVDNQALNAPAEATLIAEKAPDSGLAETKVDSAGQSSESSAAAPAASATNGSVEVT